MARQRILKPEFFKDRVIASLGAHPALVYAALWCVADDGGVARCTPELLHGEMFIRWSQFSPNMVMDCLNRLQEAGVIHIYEAGDETYCEIPNFGKHQNIQHPSKFRYPRLPQGLTEKSPVILSEDSMSTKTLHGNGDGYGIVVEGESEGETRRPRKRKELRTYTPEFEAFWKAYPRRNRQQPKGPTADNFQILVDAGIDSGYLVSQAEGLRRKYEVQNIIGTGWVKTAEAWLNVDKELWREDFTPSTDWVKGIKDDLERELAWDRLNELMGDNDEADRR